MTAREIAEPNTIFRAVVGSSVHGLALEGQDDRDEMGICIEPPEYVMGLEKFEQWVYRTQPEGARSGPGDLDLTIYSLRKFARLAAQGNPSILTLLYAPAESMVVHTEWARDLLVNRSMFASQEAGKRFLGYLISQKQRLLGERGQMRVKRPELLEAHGYDTKYAGHMLRLGYQGVEYMRTGNLTLPMPESVRSRILSVRRGEVDFNDVLTEVGEVENLLEDLIGMTLLPKHANKKLIGEMLSEMHLDFWRKMGYT
jgi:hypothetical protein